MMNHGEHGGHDGAMQGEPQIAQMSADAANAKGAKITKADRMREHDMARRHRYLESTSKKEYSDEFYTPDAIVKTLGAFDIDPCAGPKSHAKVNIRRPACGLLTKWRGRVWMNPPYLHVHEWLEKFIAHGNGIALLNGRCETAWFQRLGGGADAMLFLKGRIRFERPNLPSGHGPVGSVLIAYGAANAKALRQSGLQGIFCTPEEGIVK
jgi:hypothetical protein